MTPLQVFLTYAKIRGIMPDIIKLGMRTTSNFWGFDPATGQYNKKQATFSEIINNHFKTNGFGNAMFVSLLYQYYDGDSFLRKPRVENAHRRWTTFVNKNIVPDGNVKVGSKVKFRWWNSDKSGTVMFINRDFCRIQVKDDLTNSVYHIQPGCITESDGEEPDFSFHIRWKRKEYGVKK